MRVSFGEARGSGKLEYRVINFDKDHGTMWGWLRPASKSVSPGEIPSMVKSVEKELESVKRAADIAAQSEGWNVTIHGPDTLTVSGDNLGLRVQATLTFSMGALEADEKKGMLKAVEGIMKRSGFDRRPTFG